MNIGIYIYNQAEVLDFAGPYEVFSTASRVSKNEEPFNGFLIAETLEPVTARAGFQVLPHYSIHNHPKLDVLLIVGGVHTEEMNNPTVLQWVEQQASEVDIVATVCTGVFILANACPELSGQVTTHWDDIADLRTRFKHLDVVEGVRWVDQGKRITSGGISAGIDMSLHLVSRLHSLELAEKTAHQMEFVWTRNLQS